MEEGERGGRRDRKRKTTGRRRVGGGGGRGRGNRKEKETEKKRGRKKTVKVRQTAAYVILNPQEETEVNMQFPATKGNLNDLT